MKPDIVDRMERTVYYCDSDAGGVLYHGNYPRLFEIARSEMLKKRGLEPGSFWLKHKIHLAVSNLQLRFRRPALYGETITIETRITSLNPRGIKLKHEVYSPRFTEKPIVTGLVEMVVVDESIKASRMPQEVLDKLR